MSNKKSYYEKILHKELLKPLLTMLKMTDEEAYLHSLEVARITDRCIDILQKWNECEWSNKEIEYILMGALLHDIGKAYLPFGLQHTSAKLDKYDLAIIQTHPILGYEVTKQCGLNEITSNIILMHHANADGTGYPIFDHTPYVENSVPDYVWLVAYADRFEAMTNQRMYKKAKDYPTAWKEILSMSREYKLPYKFTRVFSEIIKSDSILPIKIPKL